MRYFTKRCSEKFAKLTRKHLCRSLFFDKFTGLGTAFLSKKRLRDRCFPMVFTKTFKSTSFKKSPLMDAPVNTVEQTDHSIF